MNNLHKTHLHSVEKANALESRLRLLLQNPRSILKRYIHSGMTVLDLGCGTGYFTLEIAKLLEKKGKVIATDVQKGMLDILMHKLGNTELQKQVQIHKNQENTLNLTDKVDFVFAFYSLHEMRCLDCIINEIRLLLKPEGEIFIAEQKFHVPKTTFIKIIEKMNANGFEITRQPNVFLSRAVVMKMTKINQHITGPTH